MSNTLSKPFQFKEFTIHQDKCAMKIGTDGVLLGAWTTLSHHPNSILDIGTGTGVIALQLAQRSDAEIIDAVELDDSAYEQAVENFENSDWGDRLFCYHASIEQFAGEIDDQYDLIVSNPPFYNDTFETNNKARNKARFTSSLSFENLIDAVVKLLSNEGVFTTIIPFKEEEDFVITAAKQGLYLSKVCHIRGTKQSDIKRSMLTFSFSQCKIIKEELIIEISRHQYTPAYIELVKDFYLKM